MVVVIIYHTEEIDTCTQLSLTLSIRQSIVFLYPFEIVKV